MALPNPRNDLSPRRTPTVAAALIVASVAFAVFSNTLGHGFVNWDDDVYVYANPTIQSFSLRGVWWLFSHFYYYAYIPVTMLSHAVDVAIWGLNPRGHHLTNILLHSANAAWVLILGLVLLRVAGGFPSRQPLSRPRGMAGHRDALLGMAIAAVLFAIHPLRAESVSWVSDRKDLLCAFFLLPGVIVYMGYSSRRGTPDGTRWYLGSFLLFLLALLSKSIAVTFPVLLLLLDWLLPGRGNRKWKSNRLLYEKIPFFLVSAIVAVLSYGMSPEGMNAYAVAHLTGLQELLFPFYSLTFSLYKTLLPIHLSPIYPRVGLGPMLAGLAVVASITGVCVRYAARRKTAMLLAWLAYLILLLPNVAGLSSGMQPVADRYSYLSTIGFHILLGAGISAALERGRGAQRLAVAVPFGALAVALCVMSLSLAAHWRSSISLWEHVIASSPAKPDYSDAYLNLGAAYAQAARPEDAQGILRRAVEIDPKNAGALFNLGSLAYSAGNRVEAVELFRRATEADPRRAKAFYNLAIVSDELGQDREALAAMIQAARLGYRDAQEALKSRGTGW